MKRGTPDHPKVLDLMTRLGLGRAHAVGVLELFWHWTARYAPAGDVGRWTDAALAAGCGWEGDPAELVEALVASRFLDRHDEARLIVHDWPEHADDAVRVALYRAVKFFADGTEPKPSRISKMERERLEERWSQARSTHKQAHAVRTKSAQPEPRQSPAPPEPRLTETSTGPAPQPGGKKALAAKATWLTPYADAWTERWGADSEPPIGEMLRPLGKARTRLGDADALERWRRFLKAADTSQWARPHRFLQGLGEWAPGATAKPRGNGRVIESAVDRNQAVLESMLRERGEV